jgi:excisionase family DNA binding protein
MMSTVTMLDRNAVQEALGISRITFLRWAHSGLLPAVKIGKEWRLRSDLLADIQANGLALSDAE